MSKNDSLSRKIFYVCLIIFCVLMMATILFPYLNILAKALNEGKDTALGGITIFPRKFTLQNFKTLLQDESIGRGFVLSVAITLLGTFFHVLITYMAAFVFSQKKFVANKPIKYFVLIPAYISGGIIPTYILYAKLGLLNNFLVYILPTCFSFYNATIIRAYMQSVPNSLIESAKIDGANDIRIAFQVIMPLCKPVLATVALWTAVGKWNDWTTTLYYVTKKNLYTLQYQLMKVLKEAESLQSMLQEAVMRGEADGMDMSKFQVTSESIRAAQIIIVTVPIIMVYPFLQKYFIKGAVLGAVKD